MLKMNRLSCHARCTILEMCVCAVLKKFCNNLGNKLLTKLVKIDTIGELRHD